MYLLIYITCIYKYILFIYLYYIYIYYLSMYLYIYIYIQYVHRYICVISQNLRHMSGLKLNLRMSKRTAANLSWSAVLRSWWAQLKATTPTTPTSGVCCDAFSIYSNFGDFGNFLSLSLSLYLCDIVSWNISIFMGTHRNPKLLDPFWSGAGQVEAVLMEKSVMFKSSPTASRLDLKILGCSASFLLCKWGILPILMICCERYGEKNLHLPVIYSLNVSSS